MRRSNSSVNAYWNRGERTWPTDHIGQQGRDQPRLQPHAGVLGREQCCRFEFGRRQGNDIDDAVAETSAKLGIRERTVIEVGSQREYHLDPPPRVGDRVHETGKELSTVLLASNLREDLLELIDHQHQGGSVGRQHPQGRPQHTGLTIGELVGQAVGSIERGAQQRCLQLGERSRSRNHLGDRPAVRTIDGALAECRNQTGPNNARLTRTARPDQRQQRRTGLEASHRLGDESITSEEVGTVVFEERTQALERVRHVIWD